jgi:transcriptional regulator CtsR
MRNISDIIEQYLKSVLHSSSGGLIEIQRNELADRFRCVPSQINYVISTRFSLEKGYVVESKRGGGGYIRIQRVDIPKREGILEHIFRTIRDEIDQDTAEGLIYQLENAEFVTEREAQLLKAAVSRESLMVKLPLRDQLRASLLKHMLIALLSR